MDFLQITEAIASCDVMHIYPDPSQIYLRRDIAKFLGAGVHLDQVCAGTGSDELIDLIFRLFDPKAVVNLPPTFGMYPFLSKISKCDVVTVNRGPAPGFDIDLPSIRAAVEAGAGVVFLASPNNPTGGMLTHQEVHELCALNAIIVVDEAYAEFSPASQTAVHLLGQHDNLIVLRTFSKWAGLAGLRVGYAVAHPVIITAIMAIKQPYNVNVAADYGARAALAAADKIMSTQVAPMLSERDRMTRILAEMGWMTPIPTASNFVLFEVAKPFVASEIVAALRKRGILVRYYPNGRLAGYIRISAGRPSDTDRLIAVMKDIGRAQEAAHGKPLPCSPTALIWDMDGVLVEVSGSYRAAIIATAAAFGATVTHADIDHLKSQGGANNDWLLTQRLIRDRSAEAAAQQASLEDVTATFERLYQGDAKANDPGLKATEYALISRESLLELKSRCPGGFAIVTGRPRADAAEAVARYGWEGMFDTMVCMEDAKAKPDPEPIRLAIQRLRDVYVARKSAGGASSMATQAAAKALIQPSTTVMIGDTVDDIRAAVAAGAHGVGAYPPDKAPAPGQNDKAAKLESNLRACGANRVLLPGCKELLDLISVKEDCAAMFKANMERVKAWASPSSAAKPGVPAVATTAAGGRTGMCTRKTKETSITAVVNLDGTGMSHVSTGIGFLDHMVSAFSKHGHIDVTLTCKGDLWIDDHHTAEDCALALGE